MTKQMTTQISPLPAHVVSRAPDQLLAGGIRFALTSEQTGGPLDLGVERVAPGGGPPLHIHHHVDEYVLVLEGALHVQLGEESLELAAGDAAVLPRGVEHTFVNRGDEECRVVWVILGGGFQPFLAELDAAATFDLEVVGPIAERHGHTLTGPPLAEAPER